MFNLSRLFVCFLFLVVSAWNMMDETYIMNDVKEKLCYVSTDFERELQAAR